MLLSCSTRYCVLTLAALCLSSLSCAKDTLEEVTVEADAIKEEIDSGQNLNLKSSRYPTFEEALSQFSGVQKMSNGSFGKSLFVSVRGASSDHTAVLVDGVLGGSTAELGRFDFSKVSPDDFESVALQSGPFGSTTTLSPIGGAVSLKTKQGRGKPHVTAKSEVGSLRTAAFYTSFSGEHEMSDFYWSASFRRSGEGHRNRFLGENDVSDEGFLKSATLNIGHYFTDTLEGRVILSTNHLDVLVDDFQGGFPVFSGNRQRTRFDRFIPQLTWFPSEKWQHELKLSYISTDLSYRSQTFPSKSHSHTKGFAYTLEWHPQENYDVLAGYEGSSENHKNNDVKSNKATYHRFMAALKARLGSSWFVEGRGVSHHHQHAGDHLIFSGKVKYAWTQNVTLFVKGGQGLKIPTLIDIYGAPPFQAANLKIRPEKSVSYEVGFILQDKKKENSVQISAYQNSIRNFILAERDALGVYTTRNRGKKTLRGIEAKAKITPFEKVVLDLGYTYTRSLPKEGLQRTSRLARHKVTASLTYHPFEEGKIFVETTYKSRRQDSTLTGLVDLGAYTKVRVGIDYHVTKKLQCYARLENAFNARYEDVFGYGARGREILAGFKVTT